MRILVVNDDGFEAEGLVRMVKAACALGDTWVVAPKEQCSAMSHSLSIRKDMELAKRGFPVPGVRGAYSLTGTPADCVKVGIYVAMDERPDVVFSGVNLGYNCGYDIAYSATVAAAIEARMNGIHAIAFSRERESSPQVCDFYLEQVARELVRRPLPREEIWNVNFPGCPLSACKGILWDRSVSQDFVFQDAYDVGQLRENLWRVTECGQMLPPGGEMAGSDLEALNQGFVSIGRVRGTVLC